MVGEGGVSRTLLEDPLDTALKQLFGLGSNFMTFPEMKNFFHMIPRSRDVITLVVWLKYHF